MLDETELMTSNNDTTNTDPRLISIVLPAYNEAAILKKNLDAVVTYLDGLPERYDWEVIVVNDGSADGTGEIADSYADGHPKVRAIHHKRNFGLGQALKFGMSKTRGDYIVTMDIDLSYSADHILRLVEKLETDHAKLVLASPYMKGGQISNVPWLRKFLSISANRFLSFVAHGRLSTLTCMVRGYDGEFGRSLVTRSTGMDIMPETIYKTMILRAGISQIPAHLDWGLQVKEAGRQSSMRILRHVFSTILSGFIFRPFMFFIMPGLLLLGFALWVNAWMLVHFFQALAAVPPDAGTDSISWAVATAYQDYPHTFIVGLLSLMLSIQLISLGILALQSKSYFEEVYFLGAARHRKDLTDDTVD